MRRMEQQRNNRGGVKFKKGESGNPKGRPPKGYSITEAFKSMLAAEPETKREIVESIRQKALKGDTTAQKLIWNYMDGMPKQSEDDPGSKDNPLNLSITIKRL